MKLSTPSISLIFALGLGYRIVVADNRHIVPSTASLQSKLVDRCCQVGKERAVESSKFNCKLSAREALLDNQTGSRNLLALAAESLLSRDSNFADQCEMVLESCCMAHHRSKNCDSGKQFAKSGAACMDVELSKEATIATESFNDCCMSCSLGILAAKNPAQQNDSSTGRANLADRCKLMSPLASSLSGQLYEQTYIECCQENIPRVSSALLEPGAPIDCVQYNPCSQRCVSAGRRRAEQDRCDCFTGYRLSGDGVTCVDVDECKTGQHTCNRKSEVCDNTRGSFRCLARQSQQARALQLDSFEPEINENVDYAATRLCPVGMRWDANEARCREPNAEVRSASLSALPSLRLTASI